MDPSAIDRELLAKMIAQHVNGRVGEEPEPQDYEDADNFIEYLDNRF
jgi:hypothetical protein